VIFRALSKCCDSEANSQFSVIMGNTQVLGSRQSLKSGHVFALTFFEKFSYDRVIEIIRDYRVLVHPHDVLSPSWGILEAFIDILISKQVMSILKIQ